MFLSNIDLIKPLYLEYIKNYYNYSKKKKSDLKMDKASKCTFFEEEDI